jgi:hypothetical protein
MTNLRSIKDDPLTIVKRRSSLPDLDTRFADDILGYDTHVCAPDGDGRRRVSLPILFGERERRGLRRRYRSHPKGLV